MISIVIPAHNAERTIDECIGSLQNQTLSRSEYEIVVVDDNSDDKTFSKCQKYFGKERIQVLRLQNKRGPAACRNLGIRNAKGDIVLFIGSDCIADRQLVEQHALSYVGEEHLAVVGFTERDPRLERTLFMDFLYEGIFQFAYRDIRNEHRVPFWYFYTSNASVRKEALIKAGLFDERLPYAAFEDVEVAYRLQKIGTPIRYNRKAVVYHNHPTTFTEYVKREVRAGRAWTTICRIHPEISDLNKIYRILREGNIEIKAILVNLALALSRKTTETVQSAIEQRSKSSLLGFKKSLYWLYQFTLQLAFASGVLQELKRL